MVQKIISGKESSIENYGAWKSDRDYDVLNYAFSKKPRKNDCRRYFRIFENFWGLLTFDII